MRWRANGPKHPSTTIGSHRLAFATGATRRGAPRWSERHLLLDAASEPKARAAMRKLGYLYRSDDTKGPPCQPNVSALDRKADPATRTPSTRCPASPGETMDARRSEV